MEALEKNIIIFGADMISSVHINNEGKDILTLNSNPFILCFMQRFENRYHFEAIKFSVHPQRSMRLSIKNTVTKNNKIKSIIMDISQSYYTLSNKINSEELMLLFNIGLSRLINKHHLISSKSFSPDFTFK